MPPRNAKKLGAKDSQRPPQPQPQPQPQLPPPPPPKNINPYTVLGVPASASSGRIRSAYLKLALKLHPDKVVRVASGGEGSAEAQEEAEAAAHCAFQELAFAYAVLSDPARKARYDATGSTSERDDGGGDFFDWANFYRAQFKEVVTTAHIEEFRHKYQGSEEEREDVLRVYEEGKGDVDYVFERVMCSEEEADLPRFRAIVEQAVESGEVPRFKAFWRKPPRKRGGRKDESKEAMDMAKRLGVYEMLFGKEEGVVGGGGGGGENCMELPAVEVDGEAEVSGEDSGDEEEGAVEDEEEEGEDGFINDGEEAEEEEEEEEKQKEDDNKTRQPSPKATDHIRSTRPTRRRNAANPPSLKDELKANLSTSTSTSKSTTKKKPATTTTNSKPKSKSKPKPKSTPSTSSRAPLRKKPRTSPPPPSEPNLLSPSLQSLQNLIQSRQKSRFATLISTIEDKYVNTPSSTTPAATTKKRKRKAPHKDGGGEEEVLGEDGVLGRREREPGQWR